LDCIYIARKGEDSIIDSIPLAEADLIVVSEDGNMDNQYKRNPDSQVSIKSNRILDKINKSLERQAQNSQTLAIAEEPTDVQAKTFTSGFKRLNSTKFFNPQITGKAEVLQQEEKSTVLQISTVAEGFNSGAFDLQFCASCTVVMDQYWAGRIYYFRIRSKDQCTQLAEDFKQRAKLAKRKAEARSRFKRNQEKFRMVFESMPFQLIIALLIFAVRYLGAPRHSPNPPAPTSPSESPAHALDHSTLLNL
jgi:hypothetical protein